MRKNLLIIIVLIPFIYGCVPNNCKQFCSEKGLSTDCCPKADILQTDLSQSTVKIINVFIETSGSMQGYMPNSNPSTNFQKIIPDILSRLNDQYLGKVNFYSIFNSQTPFGQLELNTARNNILNGNFNWSGSTYIPTMIDSITKGYLKKDVINIFISDCIYSPESNQSKVADLATTDIRSIITPFIYFSTSCFCFFSEYRNSNNSTVNSPYYLILQGEPQNIHSIESILYESISNANQVYKEINFGLKYNTPFYTVLPYTETTENFIAMPCISFEDAYISLQEINLEDGGNNIEFWIGLDLRKLPLYSKEKIYLAKNLEIVCDKGNLQIVEIEELPYKNVFKDDKIIVEKCSHLVKIKVTGLTDCVSIIKMALKCSIPDWKTTLNEISVENNREKTLGLEKIISGYEQAYCPKKSEYFFKELKISLIKE